MKKYYTILLSLLSIISIGSTIYVYTLYRNEKKSVASLTENVSYYNDSLKTYISQYPASSFNQLKEENRQLYEKVKQKDELIETIEFKYKYKFDSDEKVVGDSIQTDSLYHFIVQTDTMGYDLKIWSSNLYKYRLLFNLTNDFIITRQKFGDINHVEISSQMSGTIKDVTTWTKKEKQKRLFIGPSVGFGYGFLNKKFDIFVGGTLTLYIW